MRWNNLFDDLESQLEQELTAEEVDLQAEEERLRLGRLSLRDRMLSVHEASTGAPYSLRLVLASGESIAVQPSSFGRDWFAADLVDESPRRLPCVVPIGAVSGLILTRPQVEASLRPSPAGESARSLSARLGLGFVLRDLCRRRTPLELRTIGGVLHGTLDRVGRDHCDLAIHEPGEPRRESAVTQYRVVGFRELVLVRLR